MMGMMKRTAGLGLALTLAWSLSLALALSVAWSAGAAEKSAYSLTLKGHVFTPERLEVPAGQRITLVVDNQDPTPEEFESHDLKIEKIIPGGQSVKLRIGPLKPGEYRFVGEYNESTAKGVIVAR
jgi:plastocyanin domain-containing protein